MRYLEAMKVPWALTVSLPSTLARFSQSKIPSIRSGNAVLMVTKHSPADDLNSSKEPSEARMVMDSVSAEEVASLLVNEGPASQTD